MEDILRVGEFEVVREISRSSIASVYEGYQPSQKRKVLIKRLHPQLVSDPEIRTRFEREANAQSALQHKHIVQTFDFHADIDDLFLVTEWIEGGSLIEYVKENGPLDERQAVALAVDILSALAVAHEAGITHRDIKPNNLLISPSDGVKLTDFGLAQFEGAPALTQQGMIIGTPSYMAPEAVSGGTNDKRSDIYGVGVTLYELMTGKNPFQAENMSETIGRVLNHRPPNLDGISHEFHKILFQFLSKRPDRRPKNGTEALKLLESVAADLKVKKGWTDIKKRRPPKSTSSRVSQKTKSRPGNLWFIGAWVVMFAVVSAVIFFDRILNKEEIVPEDTLITHIPSDSLNAPVETLIDSTMKVEETGNNQEEQNSSRRQPQETLVEQPPVDETIEESSTENDNENPSEDNLLALNNQDEEEILSGSGFLSLFITPWADVFYQDSLLGQTPLSSPIKLPAGDVELLLQHPDFPEIYQSFRIFPDDTVRSSVNLMDMVGVIESINARPWADIYIDDKYINETPIYGPIILSPGSHTILFKHTELPDKTMEIDLVPGSPKTLFVDMND